MKPLGGEWTEEVISHSRAFAERGECWGQYNLGLAYYDGLGNVTQDYVQAYKWFSLCARQGIDVKVFLDLLRSKMSVEQIADAQKQTDAFVAIA